jgi:hypothetical protein
VNLDSVLAAGRAAAEARMRDTVRVYTQDPDGFDRDSGNTVPGQKHTLYEGIARVKPVSQTVEDAQAGEREVRLREYEVSLPAAVELPADTRVLPGTRIEVLDSRDPRMPGLILWVTGAQYGDQVTAWRINAEDRA